MQDIARATIRELAYKIKAYKAPRFAFLLGAGASKQSGIPIASEMIRHFKEQIIVQRPPDELKSDQEKSEWLTGQDWYKAEGSEYCKCFEKFEPKENGRQRYIEEMIEGREPSFGYVVLANLMARGHVNTIVTTNFDDLVYSACTTFTSIRPIVYAYGVLASEMRFTAQRPKILKLHGDYLYSTLKNTNHELAEQDANMGRQLKGVLGEYGLIVVGYGGGDNSVMRILSDISERNDLYWCIRRGEEPNEAVKKLLRDKRGFLVEIEGFDEMMNEIRPIVEFDVRKMIGSIEERRNQIIKQLEKFDPQYSTEILGEIVDAAKEPTTKVNEDKKINALDSFINAYTAQQAKDFLKAVELYGKAIELEPNYALAYHNLGLMLRELRRHDEAEAALRKALELDPSNAAAYNTLATVLGRLKRSGESEAAYRTAIELNPNYALAYHNLGVLLRMLDRDQEALSVIEKAQLLNSQSSHILLAVASIHKKLGHKQESDQNAGLARELMAANDWYYLACLESVCNNTDAAIEHLRRAAQQPEFDAERAKSYPDFEWIREDARFKEIVGEDT